MVAADGHNVFVRPTSGPDDSIASWQLTLKSTTKWQDLKSFQAQTGHEAGSISTDTIPSSGDVGAGAAALPPDIAAAMS
jgi:hypothetical protein